MLVLIVLLCLYSRALSQISLYPSDLYDVLFGNITTLSDILPLEEDVDDITEDLGPANLTIPERVDSLDFDLSEHGNNHDMLDVYEITRRANNITRRFYYYDTDEWSDYEDYKKGTLERVNIQWLMHIRYFVTRALRQREGYMNDKRYKLGYLFMRLRRLSYEQLKICSTAEYLARYRYRFLTTFMRFYEKVVRYDVDIRDTISLIRSIYVVASKFDKFQVTKKSKTNSTTPSKKP